MMGIKILQNNHGGLNWFKLKHFSGNEMLLIPKNFSKEIITRLGLRNKHIKCKTKENRLLHTQQRNRCVSPLRKTKMN